MQTLIYFYSDLSVSGRALCLFMVFCFCFVMFQSWKSLTGSHRKITWYNGIYSSPVFVILMWVGACVFIFPGLIIKYKKSKNLNSAKYIGNSRTKVYHSKHCEWQTKISNDIFRIPLKSKEEAHDLGYRACNWGCV